MSLPALVDQVHIKKTVGQFLFEGYSDPLIDVANMIPFFVGDNLPPFDKFGWFYTVSFHNHNTCEEVSYTKQPFANSKEFVNNYTICLSYILLNSRS